MEKKSLADTACSVFVEFRRHKTVDNPLHIIGFLSQWKVYLDGIPSGPEAQHFKGKKLDPGLIEKVRLF